MTNLETMERLKASSLLRLAIVALSCSTPALAQEPRLDTISVASIDLYGLRTIPDSTVRRAFGISTGVPLPKSTVIDSAIARVDSIPGVRRAHLDVVWCAERGGLMVYVGIEEKSAPTLAFVTAPTGSVRLPAPVLAAGQAFDSAFTEAIEHRDFAESDTAGHALMHWPAARAVQLRFVDLAARYEPELRDVLRHAADARQRALAAEVLGYVADKAKVVDVLAPALRDSDGTVRNNATRALWIIAMFSQRHPELGIHVPYASLVGMLDSPVWTDRNKSSLALAEITASRNPALFSVLRQRALPSLFEMAHWYDLPHASAALMILGRLAGMPDKAITDAIQRGDREPILEAAKRLTQVRSPD